MTTGSIANTGEFEGERSGWYFTDLKENTFKEFADAILERLTEEQNRQELSKLVQKEKRLMTIEVLWSEESRRVFYHLH